MHTELGARPEDLELVVAGYGLAFAILLITGGRLGDLYGRKRLFMIGMVGFTIASALCGLATSPAVLIASRVLQGLTAALMNPQVLAIIRVTFPRERAGARHRLFRHHAGPGLDRGAARRRRADPGGHRRVELAADLPGQRAGGRRGTVLRRPHAARVAGVGPSDAGFRRHRAGDADAGAAGLPAGGGRGRRLAAGGLVAAGWLAAGPGACSCCTSGTCSSAGRSPLVSMRLFRDPGFSLGLVMAVTFFSGLAAFFMGLTMFLQQGLGYGAAADRAGVRGVRDRLRGRVAGVLSGVAPDRAAGHQPGHGDDGGRAGRDRRLGEPRPWHARSTWLACGRC